MIAPWVYNILHFIYCWKFTLVRHQQTFWFFNMKILIFISWFGNVVKFILKYQILFLQQQELSVRQASLAINTSSVKTSENICFCFWNDVLFPASWSIVIFFFFNRSQSHFIQWRRRMSIQDYLFSLTCLKKPLIILYQQIISRIIASIYTNIPNLF